MAPQMISKWLVLLKKAVEDKNYLISGHAHKRMGERGVLVADLEKCLVAGDFLEDQDHGEDLKVLLRGKDCNNDEFYIVVAIAFPRPVIVTVCRFQKEAWNDVGSFKKRV